MNQEFILIYKVCSNSKGNWEFQIMDFTCRWL